MSAPIVFISHFRVKAGKLDDFKQLLQEVARSMQAEKPRTLVYLFYVDKDGADVTAIHAFADAESMDLHVEGVQERSRAAYEFLVPGGWEIYGTPSEHVSAMMRQTAASVGVTLTVQPEYMGGFLRVQPG